ncbi:uncharacterized protein VICG_00172 [Vittaforma corneae ATCC 50505]|uniref:Small ribosomal subunit protein eS4 central region domain-containing protein n=1 Tax=Vittaforma corneae (strain ATCC 50505) TaxID=993615 RepID=L2GRA2_VITCO|nr:uncharacterized protein VICG_00172 [Vittaforma corneae ATCC 50505]ELA42857.1 hypothetical protein VICG_00172 [Vittaforma corneae ATCC 50505]
MQHRPSGVWTKKVEKYAIRPLPGPHSKELSIPLKYVIARFLRVANTAKEVDYIASSRMIAVNGKEITSIKFPVGLFDVVTILKTNQHFRLYFNANRKFKLHKISSDEAKVRISKVVSKYTNDSIPMTHTKDGYNFKFADPSIKINDTVKIDIATNRIVGHLPFEAGKIGYVFSGPNAGRIGTIKYIDRSPDGKEIAFLQDPREKPFSVSMDKVMVIGESNSLLISMDENDGIRLNAFEISNNKYAANQQVEVEDN